ncbi:MAG: tRNA pseudouridine(38-40) synthase TruA, partial [Candidatus Omnitrophica bacterium]|nr:tRNA pseudouridine(38-40) synthase TruA [Candidatus Omnitrophota bacterium]
ADGFLYNMVRNIVGTLVEIGRGYFPPGSMRKILAAKDRKQAGPTAPARGLFLEEVKY